MKSSVSHVHRTLFCLLQRPRGRPKGSSKKVSKLVKDPNAPKRPATAYLLFCQEQRDKMKQRYPNLNFSELTRELGYKWSEMPDEQKRVGSLWDCPCCKVVLVSAVRMYTGRICMAVSVLVQYMHIMCVVCVCTHVCVFMFMHARGCACVHVFVSSRPKAEGISVMYHT